MAQAFSTPKYLEYTKELLRKKLSGEHIDRIYIHFGGKLIGDEHTSRVLPGYDADAKLSLLRQFGTDAEVVYCVAAADLARGRIRGDNGLTYLDETIRSLSELKDSGITVKYLVIVGETEDFDLQGLNEYANSRDIIIVQWSMYKEVLSDDFTLRDFSPANKKVAFQKRIVAVVSPGSNSGKYDFCLAQLYLEAMSGQKVSYQRVHTFPIFQFHPWHPLNLAFFAASADVYDYSNMFDVQNEANIEKAWRFYERDKKISKILTQIIEETHNLDGGSMQPLSIDSGITDIHVAEKEGAAEVMRRHLRYYYEVLNSQEKSEVSAFVKKLTAELVARYTIKNELLPKSSSASAVIKTRVL